MTLKKQANDETATRVALLYLSSLRESVYFGIFPCAVDCSGDQL
jgi:hypothetical protein